MWSDTPTVKNDKKSWFLVLWRVVHSDDTIRLCMSCRGYVQVLGSFWSGLTPVWPFLGVWPLTWTNFDVKPIFHGPNHAKLWSWLVDDVLDAALWSKVCTMLISKKSRFLVWHIVTYFEVTTMLSMICRVPVVNLVWFCAHLTCVWPFGHFAVPRAVF